MKDPWLTVGSLLNIHWKSARNRSRFFGIKYLISGASVRLVKEKKINSHSYSMKRESTEKIHEFGDIFSGAIGNLMLDLLYVSNSLL